MPKRTIFSSKANDARSLMSPSLGLPSKIILLLIFLAILATVLSFFLYGARQVLFPQKYRKIVREEAMSYNFDPLMIAALIINESRFGPKKLGLRGEVGMMQVMPTTISELERLKRLVPGQYTAPDLKDPDLNVKIGTAYLKWLQERIMKNEERKVKIDKWFDGDPIIVMLHSYNAGPTFVLNTLDNTETLKEYEDAVKTKRATTDKYAKDVKSIFKKLQWLNFLFPYYS